MPCHRQAVLKSVYFFHPGVWLADWMLRRRREEACDEATIAILAGDRREYGTAIQELAEQSLRPAPLMTVGVVNSGSHITYRMRRILDPQLPTGRQLSWLALVMAAAATLLPAAPRPGRPSSTPNTEATVNEVALDVETKTPVEDHTALAIADETTHTEKPKPVDPQVTIRGTVVMISKPRLPHFPQDQ